MIYYRQIPSAVSCCPLKEVLYKLTHEWEDEKKSGRHSHHNINFFHEQYFVLLPPGASMRSPSNANYTKEILQMQIIHTERFVEG